MELIIRAGILVAFLIVIPLLIGMLFDIKKTETGFLFSWGKGFVVCLGIFQILAIPCIFLEQSLTFLTAIYVIILVLLGAVSICINLRLSKLRSMLYGMWTRVKETPLIALVAVAVILFQMYMYVAYMHVDDDDAFYVATATTSVYNDSLFQINPYTGADYATFPARYVLSPFPIFIACLSRLSGIHATLLAHTLLPVILLGLAYVMFAQIGDKLFESDRKKVSCFILLVAILQMFTSSTVYMQGSFMLVRIWQGKAVLAAVLLPCILWTGMKMLKEQWAGSDWIFLMTLMFACCMVSSMGIILGAIAIGIVGVLSAIVKKDIKILVKTILCAIPNVVYSLIYLLAL